MTTYKKLNYLQENNISYIHYPFTQGGMVETLDEKWIGDCNILTHEWLLRKINAKNITDQTTYVITNPHLPHPVVHGSNQKFSGTLRDKDNDISMIRSTIIDYYHNKENIKPDDQFTEELNNVDIDKRMDALIDFMLSQPYHYGVIDVRVFFDERPLGHTVGFVKRGDAISFFDPRLGEITFTNLENFKIWFKQEIEYGALQYIVSTNRLLASDFFEPIEINQIEDEISPVSQRMINRFQQKKAEYEETLCTIVSYHVDNFYGSHYVNIDSPFEAFINSKGFESSLTMFRSAPDIVDKCKVLLANIHADQRKHDLLILAMLLSNNDGLKTQLVAGQNKSVNDLTPLYKAKVIDHIRLNSDDPTLTDENIITKYINPLITEIEKMNSANTHNIESTLDTFVHDCKPKNSPPNLSN